MKIVCDATGVEIDATPEVADTIVGCGFTLVNALVEDSDSDVIPDEEKGEPEVLPATDDGGDSADQHEQAPAPQASDKFDEWEPTKEFLKDRDIADLREFATVNEVELPKPANKGQIVNAIVAAFTE